jgi:hypothetical protein
MFNLENWLSRALAAKKLLAAGLQGGVCPARWLRA